MRRPGLFASFLVVSALLSGATGAALVYQVDRQSERRALDDAIERARVIAEVGVSHELTPGSLEHGLTAKQKVALDQAIGGADDVANITRVVLYDGDGEILYSSDRPDLVGRTTDSEHFRTAVAGTVAAKRITKGHFDLDPKGSLLEVYLPFHKGEAKGVFELYVPFSPFEQEAREDKRELVIGICAGLLLLWLVLTRLVHRASRELVRRAEDNRRLALSDTLTGLGNRTLFVGCVEEALRGSSSLAVLLLDLDRFKEINDTLGHHVGDRVLVDIAARLATVARPVDTVARLGGDEFAVLVEDVDEDEARRVAAAIAEVFERPFEIDGLALDVDPSIGIALAPRDGTTSEVLLQRADVAMYEAKRSHAGVEVYDAARDEHSPERLRLAGDLARAIEAGELVLHYQPKVDVGSGRPVGVEALVRWQHPERGLLGPDQFVPIAEQRGLIKPLTMAVLDMAMAQAAAWWSSGRRLPIAVNLSPISLLDLRLPDDVADVLGRHGAPAEALEIEVTETSLVHDPQRAGDVLGRLAAMGIGVAIDDFGTGYSSLAALRALPLDELKIDRSFVAAMVERDEDRIIVESTIQLAKNLRLRVVAEGVEDATVLAALRDLGCDVAQGYHLARPQTAAAIERWLDRTARLAATR
jgi:diguanylate cyclase (GGDEF)-like protein